MPLWSVMGVSVGGVSIHSFFYFLKRDFESDLPKIFLFLKKKGGLNRFENVLILILRKFESESGQVFLF